MAYPPRVESKTVSSLVTTRTRCSELWFVNNAPLEEAIVAYAARFATRYQVTLYALAIEGNHLHAPAHFPRGNRAAFMRDLNSCVARAVPRYTPEYKGGRLWGRRYSSEFLPRSKDVFEWFFYTALQPVKDGLVERLSDYPFYNCFHDAISGRVRKFKWVRWAEYNAAKRYRASATVEEFTEEVELRFARLPGYESWSYQDYRKMMLDELEVRRAKYVNARHAEGKTFLGRERLLKIARGSRPKNTKTSTRHTRRPRVLSTSAECIKEEEATLQTTWGEYELASRRYRAGDLSVEFPPGTYPPTRPPRFDDSESDDSS